MSRAPAAIARAGAALLAGWLALGAPGAARGGEEDPGADGLWLHARVEPAEPWAGEAFSLVLEVEYDPTLLPARLVPTFRQPLDLALALEAPWLDGLAGAVALGPAPGAAVAPGAGGAPGGATLVLNARVVRAAASTAAVEGGRVTLRLARRYALRAPGRHPLAPPRVRYARATRFGEDVLFGRVPLDREDVERAGAAPVLRIRPLPPPPAGAAPVSAYVGALRLDARLEAGASEPAQGVRIRVAAEGDGDLAALEPFGAAAFPGFDLLGVAERPAERGRAWLYEVAPRAAADARLEALAVWVFDPRGAGAWREVASAPLDLRPPGPRGEGVGAPPGGPAPEAGAGRERGDRGEGPAPAVWLALGVLVLLLLGWGVRRGRRRAARRAARAHAARPTPARERLRAALARPDADLAPLLQAWIREWTHRDPGAPDTESALRARGLDAREAPRLLEVLRDLEARSFRPPREREAPDPDTRAFLRTIVDRSPPPA